MDRFSQDDLRELLASQTPPCVSLLMPTTRGAAHEDEKRWKNLLREAEECLASRGHRPPEMHDLLRPAQELLDDVPFWQNVSHGLAGFLTSGAARFYRLPVVLAERVTVADHFHVKPLLPLFTGEGAFYVLALSQNKVRLLQGTHHTVREVEVPGIPAGYEEVRLQEGVEPRGASKQDLLEYLRKVDHGLRQVLHDQQAPLVLAWVDYVLALYRQANTYQHLLGQVIEGNPDYLSAQELRDRGWAVVQLHFQELVERVTALYRQLAGTGRAAHDPAEVLPAASRGEVQYLFIARDQERWGTFDPDAQEVDVHARQEPGDEDLLNLAAVYTLAHKGTVYAVEAGQVPNHAPLAAVFWLPIGERSARRVVSAAAQ